jgi:glucans biosynthesis protein C
MERRYDLDWLRVIAFGLLMLFHTGMLFSTWDWHVKNFETSETFDMVMRFLHQWRMPLLFFISGSAVWFAMERYAGWKFFLERHKRLLLPLIFGMLVIIPPQVYFERLYHRVQYHSFWDFYRTVFTSGSYPEGNLSWHHLWYVPYIWAYSMVMLPGFLCLRSHGGRALLMRIHGWLQRPWALFLIFVPAALSDILLRPSWPGDANNLIADWGNFSHKLTFFVIGFVLASGKGVYDTLAAHRAKFLVAAIVAFAVLQYISSAGVPFSKQAMIAYRGLANFSVWMWILAALGYGRRYLSFNHPFLRYANEAVYPFYILHQTVIIILGYYLVYQNWGIPFKFLVVVAGTFLITWGLYALLIKRWNLLRVVFGMKWRRAPESQGARGLAALRMPGLQVQAAPVKVTRNLLLVGLSLVVLTSCSGNGRGCIEMRSFQAPSLSRNTFGISDRQHLAVYLPPGYEQDSSRRFPVLYFLPNFKTDLWRYTGGTFQGFRLKDAMDRQTRLGKVREMVVVIPNTEHWLGGGFDRNSPLTGNWEDYLTLDVVRYVDGHFRTLPAAESRGLAGHGTAGKGALELALRHPDIFGSVYALSPSLFDTNGLRDCGLLQERQVAAFQASAAQWNALDGPARLRQFREYMQVRLNSESRRRFFEAFNIAYAAAVAPDLELPFPYIAYPNAGDPARRAAILRKFESGFGGWEAKLSDYQAKRHPLRAITFEYGRNDEYAWLRRGAEHVSGLMKSMKIDNTLLVHEGGHESMLGRRLETAMLPAMSAALQFDDRPKPQLAARSAHP